MPHIQFNTPINGFYDEAMMENNRGRVILFAKVKKEEAASYGVNSSGTGEDLSSVGSWMAKKGIKFKDYHLPIAVTPMHESISISTQMQWNEGGDLLDQMFTSFTKGIRDAHRATVEAARFAKQFLDNAEAHLNNTWAGDFVKSVNSKANGIATQQELNEIAKATRYPMISSASSYLTYEGSSTDINIPNLTFTFPAEDFDSTHMLKAWTLLSYLLPNIGVTEEYQGKQKKDLVYMFEEPPNGYFNPKNGFDTSGIEGTFALDVGGQIVQDLVPIGVSIYTSRARVLSSSDYISNGRQVMNYMKGDNVTGQDIFYTNDEYSKMIECQEETNIPLVIKIIVGFRFCRKITADDYKNIIFGPVADKIKSLDKDIRKTYKTQLQQPS